MVIDRQHYKCKMDELLTHLSYSKVPKDPTPKTKHHVMGLLRDVEKKGDHLEALRKRLVPQPNTTTAPRIYGLPKIHKANIPLCPIVSAFGSLTYALAKELSFSSSWQDSLSTFCGALKNSGI